jgi:hypothetical protein
MDEAAPVVDACIVDVDPSSSVEVLSAQIHAHDAIKQHGMICLRPTRRDNGRAGTFHLTLNECQTIPKVYLGYRGSHLPPPCIFTQSVVPLSDSIYSLQHNTPPLAITFLGVDLPSLWRYAVAEPALPSVEGTVDWPPSLKEGTRQVLDAFPRSFHQHRSSEPMHGMDIAGRYPHLYVKLD